MSRDHIKGDLDVRVALDRLANASGNVSACLSRIERAQAAYRIFTATDTNRGLDPKFADISSDVVAAFSAQAKSLIDAPRSYDFALASKAIPSIKQLGCNGALLDDIQGRASVRRGC